MITVLKFSIGDPAVTFEVKETKHRLLFRKLATALKIRVPSNKHRRSQVASQNDPIVHIQEMASVEELIKLTWTLHLKNGRQSGQWGNSEKAKVSACFMELMPKKLQEEVSVAVTELEELLMKQLAFGSGPLF